MGLEEHFNKNIVERQKFMRHYFEDFDLFDDLSFDELATHYNSSHFTPKDIKSLIDSFVPPALANAYNLRKFHPSFGVAVIDLFRLGITPSLANKYDSRFDDFDITSFILQYATPEYVNLYHQSFSNFDIIEFVGNNISPQIANNFVVANKHDCDISDEENYYGINQWKCGEDIFVFDSEKIQMIMKRGMTPEEAIRYLGIKENPATWKNLYISPGGFSGGFSLHDDLLRLLFPHLSSYIHKYHSIELSDISGKYFSIADNTVLLDSFSLKELEKLGLELAIFKEYLAFTQLNSAKGLSFKDIVRLYQSGLMPYDIAYLVSGIEEALGSSFSIINADKINGTLDQKSQEGASISVDDILWMFHNNISFDQLKKYHQYNSVTNIIYKDNDAVFSALLGSPFISVKKYASVWSVRRFIELSTIIEELPKEYVLSQKFVDIIINQKKEEEKGLSLLSSIGLYIPDSDLQNIRDAASRFRRDAGSHSSTTRSFKAISTGVKSFIVLCEKDGIDFICKYTDSISLHKEAKILHLFEDGNSKPQNVINSFQFPIYDGGFSLMGVPRECLHLEYIDGDTLDTLIEQTYSSQRIIPQRQLSYYSLALLHGLYELFEKNVTHRDLHPKNVLVDKKTNRLVIIDFGIADVLEEDYPSDSKDCRRYGGFDDLFSYGLLLYKMATGKHLLIDYALNLENGKKNTSSVYTDFNSRTGTDGNASWIAANKNIILNNDGSLKQEYAHFIDERISSQHYGHLINPLVQSLGVIGYINQHLVDNFKITVDELNSGRKIPYSQITPIKNKLFIELREQLSGRR